MRFLGHMFPQCPGHGLSVMGVSGPQGTGCTSLPLGVLVLWAFGKCLLNAGYSISFLTRYGLLELRLFRVCMGSWSLFFPGVGLGGPHVCINTHPETQPALPSSGRTVPQDQGEDHWASSVASTLLVTPAAWVCHEGVCQTAGQAGSLLCW